MLGVANTPLGGLASKWGVLEIHSEIFLTHSAMIN